jgi:hypothetical protein
MSELINLKTVVRPIRKLFVIEDGDISTFAKIVEFCSEDLNGIRTLILVNDESLFSENTIAMVNSHDPDAILNYSRARNDKLYDCFRILVRRMNHSGGELKAYRTHLATVQQYPAVLHNILAYQGKGIVLDDTVWAVIRECEQKEKTDDHEFTPPATLEELCFAMNCGSIDSSFFDLRKFGVFRDLKIKPVSTWQEMIEAACNEDSFIQLSTHLVGNGTSRSIWEIDHNIDDLFQDKPTVVVGAGNDLRGLTYFWNERASYERSKIVWLPAERFDSYSELLGVFDHYCLFESAAGNPQIESIMATKTKVDHSVYYFPEIIFSDSYSDTRVGQRTDSNILISHPAQKLFSRMSLFMLEVQGLVEGVWPVSAALGEMFLTEHSKSASAYFGSRIGRNGFATSTGQFHVFEDEDLFVNLVLPNQRAMFKEFFRDYQFELIETRGTKVIDRIINLLGGIEHLEIFANREIFDLLVNLTPRRTERIVSELLKRISDDPGGTILADLARQDFSEVPGLDTPKAVFADSLETYVPGGVRDKATFYAGVEKLYESKVLLRGKSFSCPECEGPLWFALQNIEAENRCYRCGHPVLIPTYRNNRALPDAFRVNELVGNAVDQGVLPVLLTLRFLNQYGSRANKYLYDCEVAVEGETTVYGELDIVFTLGRRIGIGEIKANRGFPIEQVDRLIEIGKKIRTGILLFSTLKQRSSTEVKELCEHLQLHQLSMPALILPGEVLFAPDKAISISKYFEVRNNQFFAGPFVL